jgi:hypothetical protein
MAPFIIRKSQPTYTEVHIDAPLTNMSVAFAQSADSFLAGQVFPRVPVMKKSDKYFTFDRSYFLADHTEKRAIGAAAARSGYLISNDSYECERLALGTPVPDGLRDNADTPIQLDRSGVNFLTSHLLIGMERDWATAYFAGSIWDNTLALSNGKWSDANSDPVTDVKTASRAILENTAQKTNVLVCGKLTYDRLTEHPDVIDRIKYSAGPGNPAIVNRQTLAQLFEVERVLVGTATRNTAAEGVTATYDFVCDEDAVLLVYAAPNAGIEVPSGGYTFTWRGTGNGMGLEMKRYREDHLESDIIEGGVWFDHKLVSAALGSFQGDVVD